MNNTQPENFRVMEWLRATRDELSQQYVAMSDEQKRAVFAKEQWVNSLDVVLPTPSYGQPSRQQHPEQLV